MIRSTSPAAAVWVAALLSVSITVAGSACNRGKSEDAPGSGAPSSSPGTRSATPGTQAPGGGAAAPASRGPEHAVYSLEHNRLSAHVLRDNGLVVLGGSTGFAKYLRFRGSKPPWKMREKTADGQSVALMGSSASSLYIPMSKDDAAAASSLFLRVYNDAAKALTVRINGQKDREHTQQMPAGWATLTVPLANGALGAGENEITFFTGKGAPTALAWMHVGQKPLDGDATPAFYAKGEGLVLPEGGGLRYFVMAPKGARLVGDLKDASCRITVTAVAQNGKSVQGELRGMGSAVELGDVADQPVSLTLIGAGCATAHLGNAALSLSGPAPTVKRGPKPEYVILWIMDSLRADRVRPFNPKARPETPIFEKLATNSAFFAQTYVQGNESRVSHASIWSSLYPVKHAMLGPKDKLASKWTTLDEVVDKAGKYVSGVGANGYMDPKWGFGTEWDIFRNHIHLKLGLKGEDVYEAAIATVDGKKDPWFLYVGTIDTHVSWRPKEPWISKYHEPGYKGRFAKSFSGGDAEKGLSLTDAEIKWVRAIYDSNVSYQDDLVGKLLQKLEEWGIADKTMLIITADHGDEQWEHERVGHGGSLRDTLEHVPLVVHYPPLFPAGMVSEGAEVVDILPTIADALGQDMDPEWQGQSLLPLAQGVGAGYPLMSMASQYENAHAVRMGVWKLRASGGSTPELFRLDSDPFENKDVGAENPIAFRFLADPLWMLRTHNTAWRKSVFGNAANTTAAFPENFGE